MPAVARAHQTEQERLSTQAGRGVREVWSEVDPDDLTGSWAGLLPRLVRLVVATQAAAAALSRSYLAELLGEAAPPVAEVVPGALSGTASDGRDLATLLAQPMITVLSRIDRGESPSRALAAGLLQLETITRTQVSDTARAADHVGMAARPSCVAYTRVVELPACARCIILAGRTYPWSTGFQRHPQCDCGMVPMRPGETRPGINARELFEDMSPAEQARRFGPGGAEAIREGADLAQVVNARRGMQSAAARNRGRYTTEGTTPRGIAGRRLGDLTSGAGRYRRSSRPRLMPEVIMREARTRDEAIELLREHGYLS
ncbi:VG15 protein [Nocardiopsis suaedae]|uniref:Capsid maturation protease n=1 Tax=Nocardiopsis suaedae TaxID=3018444 RepID=A0ABT4TLY8_9ACTN|nr:hypothetical protein [Nocardiopsis suaedae]MDA2805712.1 hypothetical protein [Nocardiopsis suaedae]